MLSDRNTRYISVIKNLALKVVSIKTYLLTKRQTSRGEWMCSDNADLRPGLKGSYVAIGVE